MDPMTLAVAGVAAAAIFLIAIGIATSGSGSGVERPPRALRLRPRERQAATRPARAASPSCSRRASPLAQLNRVVEQRDFGANLARDIARADLKLKPSEFLAIWAGVDRRRPAPVHRPARSACRRCAARSPCSSAPSSASCCRASGSAAARAAGSSAFNKQLPDTITLLANAPPRRLVVPPGDRAGRARVAAADLDRVRPRHPRGQPRPAVRAGAGEHGPPRPVRRPRADGHGHQHPAHRSAATSPRSSTRSRSRSASGSGSRARSGP